MYMDLLPRAASPVGDAACLRSLPLPPPPPPSRSCVLRRREDDRDQGVVRNRPLVYRAPLQTKKKTYHPRRAKKKGKRCVPVPAGERRSAGECVLVYIRWCESARRDGVAELLVRGSSFVVAVCSVVHYPRRRDKEKCKMRRVRCTREGVWRRVGINRRTLTIIIIIIGEFRPEMTRIFDL